MEFQELINQFSEISQKERSNYHATFGDLIDKLKKANESTRISPKIVGIGAYRGYYSDIVLCTKSGSCAYNTEFDFDSQSGKYDEWEKENKITITFVENPKQLAEILESLLGKYFDGYKGGFNEITRDKPLWVASDCSNCSDIAVIDINDNLELITKEIYD